jgi:hypothetical protein
MSRDFLINVLSSEDFQTICYAILLILCIANLIVIFVIVISRCEEIYVSGGDCGVGIGWSGLAAVCMGIGAVSAWGLYRGIGNGPRAPSLTFTPKS